MNGINLLPWREQQREMYKIKFFFALGMSAIAAILSVILIHVMIAKKIASQAYINNYIQKEITTLNKQIAKIDVLKEKKKKLLQHVQFIQTLQTDRFQLVKFYDALVRIMPDDIYIQTIKRDDNNITLIGEAKSNTPVSQLMQNIENTLKLTNPVLIEITTIHQDKIYNKKFKMQLQQKTHL